MNITEFAAVEAARIEKQNGHQAKAEVVIESSLLTVKSAAIWLAEAAKRPVPKMLCGELWYEGEVCIMFADTNAGKSILGVQIADCITRGRSLGFFKVETPPQTVLYCDFELSDKQFEARYSVRNGGYFENHFEFSENFLRAEINPHSELPNGFADFESFLNFSLEQEIVRHNIKTAIIDNITYLRNETEQSKNALPLMKHLQKLQQKFDLSLLVLAHTPKRDLTKPLTRNDLGGSKMLMNFCDSSFAVGESHKDPGLRYVKQIKARNTEIVYGGENVAVCQIEKPDNFLKFEFLNFSTEREHLKTLTENEKAALPETVGRLYLEGKSYREIGFEVGVSHETVRRILKNAGLVANHAGSS